MRETHYELARLLSRRLVESGEPIETPITVAELHRSLVPYQVCRSELGLASKAEYDLALLRMLVEAKLAILNDPALVRAVTEELTSPEPGLAFLQRFAASELRVGPEAVAGPEATTPEAASSSPGPAPIDMELGVGPDELIPGLDDLLFRPDGVPDETDPAAASLAASDPAPPAAEPPDVLAEIADRSAECWSCGADVPGLEGVRFCIKCGADQSSPVCRVCGREIEREWAFCAFCGETVAEN
jgi:hypothetical protein